MDAYSAQYVDRPRGEPARLAATESAARLVAAANVRLQQKRSWIMRVQCVFQHAMKWEKK